MQSGTCITAASPPVLTRRSITYTDRESQTMDLIELGNFPQYGLSGVSLGCHSVPPDCGPAVTYGVGTSYRAKYVPQTYSEVYLPDILLFGSRDVVSLRTAKLSPVRFGLGHWRCHSAQPECGPAVTYGVGTPPPPKYVPQTSLPISYDISHLCTSSEHISAHTPTQYPPTFSPRPFGRDPVGPAPSESPASHASIPSPPPSPYVTIYSPGDLFPKCIRTSKSESFPSTISPGSRFPSHPGGRSVRYGVGTRNRLVITLPRILPGTSFPYRPLHPLYHPHPAETK